LSQPDLTIAVRFTLTSVAGPRPGMAWLFSFASLPGSYILFSPKDCSFQPCWSLERLWAVFL